MRRLTLLVLLGASGCSLLTDFDRQPTVYLELTGNIPEPEVATNLPLLHGICVNLCALAQSCLYNEEADTCPHAPDGAPEAASNDAIFLSSCVGICLASAPLLAQGPQDPTTCDELAQKPLIKNTAEELFCNATPQCETSICTPFADSTLFEVCIGISLGSSCSESCEALPSEFWACVMEDTWFEAIDFRGQFGDNPNAEENRAIDNHFVETYCASLGRCAGSEVIFDPTPDDSAGTP